MAFVKMESAGKGGTRKALPPHEVAIAIAKTAAQVRFTFGVDVIAQLGWEPKETRVDLCYGVGEDFGWVAFQKNPEGVVKFNKYGKKNGIIQVAAKKYFKIPNAKELELTFSNAEFDLSEDDGNIMIRLPDEFIGYMDKEFVSSLKQLGDEISEDVEEEEEDEEVEVLEEDTSKDASEDEDDMWDEDDEDND